MAFVSGPRERQAWRDGVVTLRCFVGGKRCRACGCCCGGSVLLVRGGMEVVVDGGASCLLLLPADAVLWTGTLRRRPGSSAYQLLLKGAVGLRTWTGFGLGHGWFRGRREVAECNAWPVCWRCVSWRLRRTGGGDVGLGSCLLRNVSEFGVGRRL